MKTLLVLFLIGAPVVWSLSASAAAVTDTIVKTTYNSDGPQNLEISIKNVDLHRIDASNEATTNTSFSLSVYLWSKSDLGQESGAINLVDANDPSLQMISATGVPSSPAKKVGFDSNTGYFVYLIEMPVDTQNSNHASALYASVNEQGALYYSNEGNPESYFDFVSE